MPKNAAAQAALKPAPLPAGNQTISIIIRCHRLERLPMLDEALFSLAVQEWPAIELVIVLQNGTEEFKQSVTALVGRQPWLNTPACQILPVPFPSGVDGRSTMITKGIEKARGRYLAFLDDDDYVYHHGYKLLIQRLAQTDCAIAVGGTRTATMIFEHGSWFVITKASPFIWGKDTSDLLFENFIPIHSYVIDRARVSAEDLYFDVDAPPLEDYEFLLRLAAKYEFDFVHLRTPVCEYRWHADNSVARTDDPMRMVSPQVLRARQKIQERKQEIQLAVPISQWVELRRMLMRNQSIHLPQPNQQRVLYILADKFYVLLDRYPDLARKLGRMSFHVTRALGFHRSEPGRD